MARLVVKNGHPRERDVLHDGIGLCAQKQSKGMGFARVTLNLGLPDCSNQKQAPNPCPDIEICGDYAVTLNLDWTPVL